MQIDKAFDNYHWSSGQINGRLEKRKLPLNRIEIDLAIRRMGAKRVVDAIYIDKSLPPQHTNLLVHAIVRKRDWSLMIAKAYTGESLFCRLPAEIRSWMLSLSIQQYIKRLNLSAPCQTLTSVIEDVIGIERERFEQQQQDKVVHMAAVWGFQKFRWENDNSSHIQNAKTALDKYNMLVSEISKTLDNRASPTASLNEKAFIPFTRAEMARFIENMGKTTILRAQDVRKAIEDAICTPTS